jgi:CDP-glycerol glycerophosphotransferase
MRIVFNSFEGRYSDTPRVLFDALGGPSGDHVWLADPRHWEDVPPEVAAVEYGSAASVEALETADLVIANTHTDIDWRKTPGTRYLQTWHGTPLKRIHWDVLWAPEGRLERLSSDVARWDCLVSPNRASTALLRRAFRHAGEVLESGYPRNDLLSAERRDEVRARVRERLGIADGVTAVLYTPTWRDDMVFADGGRPLELDLDVLGAADALGDDHCLLLRLHYMLTGRLELGEHPGVREVSAWPDVTELYLAADVLVTDYSSTMFDFAVTGKPILFHVPDLEDYGSRLRGFYFPLEPIAPGPLLETTEELVGALRDLDAVTAAHAERYAAFRRRFTHLEDGRATRRVLEWIGCSESM